MRRLGSIGCAVLALLLLCLGVLPGWAQKRVALVIGNDAYRFMPALRNPGRDAGEVAAALTRLGFATTRLTNADARAMNDGLKRFAQSATGAEIVFVFYSGHGAQFEGRTWLLPVDARLDSREDVNDADLLALDRIAATLRDKSAVRIIVLDACRDNPMVNTLNLKIAEAQGFKNATLTKGLGRPITAVGDLVVYATQAGAVASDGDGRNSPFAASLLKHIETSDLDVRQLFFRVQEDVALTSKSKQLPEVSNSIIGEFKLKITVTVSRPDEAKLADAAERAWAASKDTTNQAVLEDFIRRYGDSFYATLARARLEELQKAQVAAAVPAVEPARPPVAPSAPVVDEAAPPPQPNATVAAVAPPVAPAASGPCGGSAATVSLAARAPCPLTTAEERSLKRKDVFKECAQCPEMVVVSPGSFMMGTESPREEWGHAPSEYPKHSVTIARQFAVGRFAVTFEEWDACVADGGCDGYRPDDQGWGRGRQPVIDVSWEQAQTYLGWLSRKTGRTYRLLTEAEREFVARAGTQYPFWWGASINTDQANYNGTQTYGGAIGEFRRRTVPVDSFAPSPWGLYQMNGNVWEWVEDCFHDSYRGAPSDGSAWISGNCNWRVLRGGSWSDLPQNIRSATRSWNQRGEVVGFRVARTL
jgi:formylglycine-generating enzyme required for sulfatase activity